jgi:hypothetical protein
MPGTPGGIGGACKQDQDGAKWTHEERLSALRAVVDLIRRDTGAMMTLKLALTALVVGVAGLAMLYWWMARPQNTAATIICPEIQSRTTQMALKETAADVARASAALSGPEPENAIRSIAADLKRRYPHADSAEIVNYLLTAYCPLVKEERGLDDRQRRARMDRFSTQVYALVH